MKQSSNPKMMGNEVTQQLLAEYRVGFKSVPELKGSALQKAPFWWRRGRVGAHMHNGISCVMSFEMDSWSGFFELVHYDHKSR